MYTKHVFKDADDSMATVLNTLNTTYKNDIVAAQSYAVANQSVLGTPISAELINEIENEILTIETELFSNIKNVFYSPTMPIGITANKIWIGD